MGIHKLMALIKEKAPDSVRKIDLKALSGRQIACVKFDDFFRMQVWLCINFWLQQLLMIMIKQEDFN